jgi:hypothetical protein
VGFATALLGVGVKVFSDMFEVFVEMTVENVACTVHPIQRVGAQAGPFDCQPKYVCQIGVSLPLLAKIL